jgi:hypothetical protein
LLSPQPGQIFPRLFWPALAVSLAFGLAAWSQALLKPEAFTLHWFRNPVVLRAVHWLAVGHLGLLFLAVIVQALPVLLHLKHSHPGLSGGGLGLWTVGALALTAFMAAPRALGLLAAALAAMATGYGLLSAQAAAMALTGRARGFAWKGLAQAMFYLGAMLALGGAMAWGLLTPLLPQEPLATLQLHVHLGLWGFAGLSVFGFLPKLLRLFQASTGYPAWPLKACFACVHAGLALLLAHWLGLKAAWMEPVAGLSLLAGSLFFALQWLLLLLAARARRLDSSLSLQLAGLACLLPAASLDAWLLAGHGEWRQAAAALALGLAGFVGLVLLGTLQRICAVLAWFQRFYGAAMTHAVPTAWALIPRGLAWALLPLQAGATLALAAGLWRGQAGWIRAGGALGCAAQLGMLALAGLALTLGRAIPFPDGKNPYEEWAHSQAQ